MRIENVMISKRMVSVLGLFGACQVKQLQYTRSARCASLRFVREIVVRSEFCTNFPSWRYELQCEFLREFQDEYSRSILAFVERVKR